MSSALFRGAGRLAAAVLVATLGLLGCLKMAAGGFGLGSCDEDCLAIRKVCLEELDLLVDREVTNRNLKELGEKIDSLKQDLRRMVAAEDSGEMKRHCSFNDVRRVYVLRLLGRYLGASDHEKAEGLFLEAIKIVGNGDTDAFREEVVAVASLGDLVDLYLKEGLPASRLYTKLESVLNGIKLPSNSKNILVDRANAIYSLVPRFSSGDAAPSCRTASTNPAIRALLIGNQDYTGRIRPLSGSVNDVRLIEKSLQVRGGASIRVLINANRDTMIAEMRRLVNEVKCGDFVLFHFSGHRTPAVKLDDLSIPIGWEGGLVPIDAEIGDKTWSAAIWNVELANFVTAIRNRRASVVLVLDSGAHAVAIRALQDRVAAGRGWVSDLGPSQRDVLGRAPETEQLDMLDSEAAGYAIFDPSSTEFTDALEVTERPKDSTEPPQKYGLLSYALARSLQTQAQLTVRQVADGIAKELASFEEGKYSRGYGKVVASDPEMRFLEPARPLNLNTLAVEILSPKFDNRAAEVITLDEPSFELIGRVPDASSISYLTLNHRVLVVDSNGKFTTKVTLVPGQNALTFDAFGYDRTFRTKTIEFSYNGDLERFAATGERYALVIGIKDYDNYPSLQTPENDAVAVAEALRKSYGFRTTLDLPGGQKRDLVLHNATRQQITSTLTQLRQRLTKNDSLLIYYAGHGRFLKDNDTAYWIPKDGDANDTGSWLSSYDLTSTLKLMDVRSVLVVSDSCFSGAMTRDPPDLTAFSDDRRRALLKAGDQRSRIFISSGGTEPVLDKGCKDSGDHSIFACAFLAALKEINDAVFSSGDLYQMYLFPRVSGRVQQEPQRKEIRDSGHAGGDFIFAKSEAQALGRKVEAQIAR